MPLIAKAKKSVNEILHAFKNLSCSNLNLFTKLFDSKVYPTLSYSCELWGTFGMEEVERVHLFALKRFLNVSLHCSNKRVYSETGRYPLSINHRIRVIKFWLKIKKYSMNRIVKQSYNCLLNLALKGQDNWVSNVRDVLSLNGYGIVWLTGEVGSPKLFFKSFKETLIDNFRQDIYSRMAKDGNCNWYFGIKQFIDTESYLVNTNLKLYLRNVLIKFRLGTSQINCHKFMFSNCDMSKMCSFCIRHCYENELHMLFVCPLYDDLRREYLSSQKYSYDELLNCKHNLRNLFTNDSYIKQNIYIYAF